MKPFSRRPGWWALAAAAVACVAIGVPAVTLASPGIPARPLTPKCGNFDTLVWMGLINNTASGRFEELLEFSNVSNHACHLFGFPGVSALNASFRQIGPPASRSHLTPHSVTLEKHQTAHAVLIVTDTAFIVGCKKANVTALKVFPPNLTQQQFVVHFGISACRNKVFMQINPVTPGIGFP